MLFVDVVGPLDLELFSDKQIFKVLISSTGRVQLVVLCYGFPVWPTRCFGLIEL